MNGAVGSTVVLGATGEYHEAARFLRLAMTEIGGLAASPAVRLLDLGCGRGDLIACLTAGGYDAYGCDIKAFWRGVSGIDAERFAEISRDPYRLPFDDESFHAVLSTSVLEHAQNKTEIFREVRRMLKPGGYSMHLYPGKWYLPAEPHIYVLLVNFFWPHCPGWWLALWAILGVRNEHQHGMGWREVVRRNRAYCRTGLSYWSNGRYRRVSIEVFGNHASPMVFFIENSYGGVARLLRALPLKRSTGWVAGEIRMHFMVQRKPAGCSPS